MLWLEKSVLKTDYLFCPNQKGFSPASLMKRCGGWLFTCGFFGGWFFVVVSFFSKLMQFKTVHLILTILHFPRDKSNEACAACLLDGNFLCVQNLLIRNLLHRHGVCQYPKGPPSPSPCADKYPVFYFDPLMKSACFIVLLVSDVSFSFFSLLVFISWLSTFPFIPSSFFLMQKWR